MTARNSELTPNGRVLWCLIWETRDADRRESHSACSLHLTEAKGKEFCKRYWSSMPEHAPSNYLSCTGIGYECRVDERTYRRIEDSDIGLWCVTIPPRLSDAVALLPPRDFMSLTEGRMLA
jgi:hypothetical protein